MTKYCLKTIANRPCGNEKCQQIEKFPALTMCLRTLPGIFNMMVIIMRSISDMIMILVMVWIFKIDLFFFNDLDDVHI